MPTVEQFQNLHFYSEFKTDKIVYSTEGTITDNGSATSDTINHNYGKLCFPILFWTVDGTKFYSSEQSRVDTPGVGGDITSGCWPENTTNTCYVYFDNNSGSSQTATYYLGLILPEEFVND